MREDAKETPLESPIKVRWTGYARDRIQCYNGDFSTERSDLVQATLERQKTNVVIETVEEGEAVVRELDEYHSTLQRDWMNEAMDNALNRVQSEIVAELEQRGWFIENESS